MDTARATKDVSSQRPSASLPGSVARRRAAMRLQARERRRETQRLGQALEDGLLRLAWTPRRHLDSGTLAAQEAALHWPRGDLSVAAALQTTCDRAIAQRIGLWMVESAARQPAGPLMVSVPLPAVTLTSDLADAVFKVLAATGLPPERLELRLAEISLVQPSTEVLLTLSALRDGGVRLALEDFGMRYGSAIMLRNLPLNVVHLDPSLTHDLDRSSDDTRLTAGLIGIAHALRLKVVARAVDSPDRLAALVALGVDQGTGGWMEQNTAASGPVCVQADPSARRPPAPPLSHAQVHLP